MKRSFCSSASEWRFFSKSESLNSFLFPFGEKLAELWGGLIWVQLKEFQCQAEIPWLTWYLSRQMKTIASPHRMEVSSIITPRQPLRRLSGWAGGAWRGAGRSCRGRCCCTSSTSVWSTVDYECLKVYFDYLLISILLIAVTYCWVTRNRCQAAAPESSLHQGRWSFFVGL